MTARFNARGNRMPVTVIQASPNIVIEANENNIKIGAGVKKNVKKTENGFVKVAGFAPRIVKEVKLPESTQEEAKTIKPGDKLTVSIFSPGDIVKVTGTTKGKGFAGGVKRWGFAGGPKTHGQSDRHRAPGSIGQTTTPGRVFRGKKMAGHMGNATKTITGLAVVAIDETKNQLLIKGPVPGTKNGIVIVEKTGIAKNPANYRLSEEVEEIAKVDEGSAQDHSNATDGLETKDSPSQEAVLIEKTLENVKNEATDEPETTTQEVEENAK